MKKIAVVAVVAVLSACSNTHKPEFKAEAVRQDPQLAQAVNLAPDWMSRLPKEPGYIYENGTATSIDFGMADLKAKTIAYTKICTSAGGTIRSQMKMFRADAGETSVEQSELAVRSMCKDINITGVETVEMRHASEGNRIRTYALVRLPLGTNNTLKSVKDAERRAPEAFQELDKVSEPKTDSRPASTSGAVKTTEGEFRLLEVDNAEYRARREEALKKEGAVVGQSTLR